MRVRSFVLLIVPCVVATMPFATTALAEGLRIQPGLWELRSSLPEALQAQGGSTMRRACLREHSITPERVMAELRECRITKAVIRAGDASWHMRCETPLGLVSGSGAARSNGSVVRGRLDLTMSVGSFEIPAEGSFEARRIGDCR